MALIEDRTGKFRIHIQAECLLAQLESPYQKIDVFQTEQFGAVLVLDNNIQTTEADEFFYHEMLVHPPMSAHPNPTNVLVIGGGDGGALEEVLKHRVDRAVMVEIDEMVVQTARKYLTTINKGSFDAPNAQIIFQDAYTFLERTSDQFDVIIVDCTDPIGPGKVLYTPQFYALVRKRLNEAGIVSAQTESPILQPDVHALALNSMRAAFEHVSVYLGVVPTYPCGIWSYALAAGHRHGHKIARTVDLPDLRYYQPDQHEHYFALPTWYRQQYNS